MSAKSVPWSRAANPDTGEFTYFDEEGEEILETDDIALSEDCIPVDIEGPNGQVNHGTFVSNMVHDLKDGYSKDMGPFGQWVKQD